LANTVDFGILQKTMSELVSTADGDVETSMSDMPSSESVEPVNSEAMQCEPTGLSGLKEETSPNRDETPDGDLTEKSELKHSDIADVMQPSAPVSSQLTTMNVTDQLAVLHDTVKSLKTSNDELRQIISDGMTKVGELEVAYATSVARNKELEQQLARLSGSSERTITDVALLSTSLAQISVRADKLDKQAEVKAAAATDEGSGEGAAAAAADMSSLLPVIEQRVGELEVKVQQSATRFGEFASALDSIERDLQRYMRRHSLIVENLSPKEDRSASDAFLIFVNSVLEVTVDDSDIDGYHLLDRTNEDGANATNTNSPEKKKDFRPRPLLITFTCYRTRTQVYKVLFIMYSIYF